MCVVFSCLSCCGFGSLLAAAVSPLPSRPLSVLVTPVRLYCQVRLGSPRFALLDAEYIPAGLWATKDMGEGAGWAATVLQVVVVVEAMVVVHCCIL